MNFLVECSLKRNKNSKYFQFLKRSTWNWNFEKTWINDFLRTVSIQMSFIEHFSIVFKVCWKFLFENCNWLSNRHNLVTLCCVKLDAFIVCNDILSIFVFNFHKNWIYSTFFKTSYWNCSLIAKRDIFIESQAVAIIYSFKFRTIFRTLSCFSCSLVKINYTAAKY